MSSSAEVIDEDANLLKDLPLEEFLSTLHLGGRIHKIGTSCTLNENEKNSRNYKLCEAAKRYTQTNYDLVPTKLAQVTEADRSTLRTFLDANRQIWMNSFGNAYVRTAKAFDKLNAEKFPEKYPSRGIQAQAITENAANANTFEEWVAAYEDPYISVYPVPTQVNEQVLLAEASRIIEKETDPEVLEKWYNYLHWEDFSRPKVTQGVRGVRQRIVQIWAALLLQPLIDDIARSTTKEELVDIESDYHIIKDQHRQNRALSDALTITWRKQDNGLVERAQQLIKNTNDETTLIQWTQVGPRASFSSFENYAAGLAADKLKRLARSEEGKQAAANTPRVKLPPKLGKGGLLGELEPWTFWLIVGIVFVAIIAIIAAIAAAAQKKKSKKQTQSTNRNFYYGNNGGSEYSPQLQ